MGLTRDIDNIKLAVECFTFQTCLFFEENRRFFRFELKQEVMIR